MFAYNIVFNQNIGSWNTANVQDFLPELLLLLLNFRSPLQDPHIQNAPRGLIVFCPDFPKILSILTWCTIFLHDGAPTAVSVKCRVRGAVGDEVGSCGRGVGAGAAAGAGQGCHNDGYVSEVGG